ncbi:hypothetical protein, partial [Peribacillus sp. NPDC056705]|uniref:hypothetical protein n=1 Tax=Peribacillus sp. NPDC056705 TaxID=3345918 RepID=UPI003748954B
RQLERDHPQAFASLQYMEQPMDRELSNARYSLKPLIEWKPIIADESLSSLPALEQLDALGWSGIALKTCKGHSLALIAYCWAKSRDRYVTMQDLTNVGHAFVHAANLASHLALSTEALEYNSRQYAPDSQAEVQKDYHGLFQVRDGSIHLEAIRHIGLY